MDDNCPPAKKRTASRQLSKDDGSDSDGDHLPEGGSFQKASDEVIAARRIVKVKRSPATSSAAPAPNPFAAIRLVPPLAPLPPATPPVVPADVGESVSNKKDLPDLEKKEDDPVNTANHESGALIGVDCRPSAGKPDMLQNGETPEPGDNGRVEQAKEDRKGDVDGTGPVELVTETNDNVESSDHAQSIEDSSVRPEKVSSEAPSKASSDLLGPMSSKVAFTSSLGPVGTSLRNTSFSFGTTPSSFGTPTGFASFRSSWTFASASASGSTLKPASEGAFSLSSTPSGSSNGSTFQLFGSQQAVASSTTVPLGQTSTSLSLQEVPVETGEEQDKVVFAADATLFEFVDATWKERGKGEIKVNVSKATTGRSRLLMRSKGNYRLLLNASLFPDMKLASMDSRGVTFVCANSVEGKNGMSLYAAKMKDSLSATAFREAVDIYKGKAQVDLKTPECSPRATHDLEKDADAVES